MSQATPNQAGSGQPQAAGGGQDTLSASRDAAEKVRETHAQVVQNGADCGDQAVKIWGRTR